MKRKIVGYHQDEKDDWVADLDCFHGQHVRHEPLFFNRPWSATAEGRKSKLGEILDCKRCDVLEFPEGLKEYKRTPVFTQDTIPKGLLKHHTTKLGTWGKIHVLEGKLLYNPEGRESITLLSSQTANIPPEMQHDVAADGSVRFYVAFYTLPIEV
ncbi:DUF3565 domain-containing protein [Ghiorsea bivora]|uniref:DUF3565 domain-containing protein n=1 Tax=Ghiorsea bivora TaxID=1485545 RepID=UPI00056F516B|nr:DUF3565 domain-containing protein [Ghiorsea bivora]